MKLKFLTLVFTVLTGIAAAQAQGPLDTQYYGHLRDACKRNTVERLWNRYFGDEDKSLSADTCCLDSVAAMEKKKALIAEGGICPEGMQKNSLPCPTTKEWCEQKAS